MVAVEVAKAAAVETPIRAEPEPEVRADAAVAEAEEEKEYKSDMKKLEELMSKLNPCAKEFVPSSRRAAPAPAPVPGAGLSADAPVFVSAADLFGAGRDSSSDGSSNGAGQPQNRRVGEP
jgi:hypothetical protein